jgi:hypothetical protein
MSRRRTTRPGGRSPQTGVPGEGGRTVGGPTPKQSGTAKDDRRRQRRTEAAVTRRRRQLVRWGQWAAMALVAAGVAAWVLLRSDSQTANGPGGLPGPRGGQSVAQDVNTLVGKRAPAFTLADSAGSSYVVTPGTGRPLVLVFHMGIT